MRTLITLLAASTLVGGCSCAEADLYGLPVERDVPAVVDTAPAVPAPADTRIPGGWFEYEGIDPAARCTSPLAHGVSIPCSDVLNVCAWNVDSGWTNVMLPTVFSCTDASPTLADVCRTRPVGDWPYYGLDDERCAALTSR